MEYTVERATEDVRLIGDRSEMPWNDASTAEINRYPWNTGANRQGATVRVLYDETALYLQYQVEDTHSTAQTTTLDGPVYEASAIELFTCPEPDYPLYLNFETNRIGTLLIG